MFFGGVVLDNSSMGPCLQVKQSHLWNLQRRFKIPSLYVTPRILLMDKIQLTTKDDDYPIIYRVLTIPGGAGFRPSTVSLLTVVECCGDLLFFG